MALPKACRSLAGCDLLSLVLRMGGTQSITHGCLPGHGP